MATPGKTNLKCQLRQLVKERFPVIWVSWDLYVGISYRESPSLLEKYKEGIDTFFMEHNYRCIRSEEHESVYVMIADTPFVSKNGYGLLSCPVRNESGSFVAYGIDKEDHEIKVFEWCGKNAYSPNIEYLDEEHINDTSYLQLESQVLELVEEEFPILWINWSRYCVTDYLSLDGIKELLDEKLEACNYKCIRHSLAGESIYVKIADEPYAFFDNNLELLSVPVRAEDGSFIAYGHHSGIDGLTLLAFDVLDTKGEYIDETGVGSLSTPRMVI